METNEEPKPRPVSTDGWRWRMAQWTKRAKPRCIQRVRKMLLSMCRKPSQVGTDGRRSRTR
ncbi:hypothetical protein BJV77DRAFT_1024511 [Russula vinacea]|nr:hypothetical protein BJV77DRAFT_1024511 [Russula vinacea]